MNTRNKSKYVITKGPWKGLTVTPTQQSPIPGCVLAQTEEGHIIHIKTEDLTPAHEATKASKVAEGEDTNP